MQLNAQVPPCSNPIGPALPPKSGLGEDSSEGTGSSDPQGPCIVPAVCLSLCGDGKMGLPMAGLWGPVLCGLGLGGRNVLFLLSVME